MGQVGGEMGRHGAEMGRYGARMGAIGGRLGALSARAALSRSHDDDERERAQAEVNALRERWTAALERSKGWEKQG